MRVEADELPIRPYLPPSFAGCAAALLVAWFVLAGAWDARSVDGWHVDAPQARIVLSAGACAMLLAGALACHRAVRRGERFARLARWLGWAGVMGLLSLASSASWVQGWNARAAAVQGRAASSFDLAMRGDARAGAYGVSATAELYDGEHGCVAAVRATADEELASGERLRVTGQLEALDASDWGRSRFMKGEVGSLRIRRVLERIPTASGDAVAGIRSAALERIDPDGSDGRALIAGVVCGRTTELAQTEANDLFARCGLSHLVAVSGSHLAYIAVLLQAVLGALGAARARRMAALVITMGLYVLFTGGAASAVRSVVMVVCSYASLLGGRRSHALSGLSLTACALAVLDPGIAFDLGFQLSAASVLFILVFGRYAVWLLRRLGLPQAVADPLALTLVAQWATCPLTLPVFGQLSLIAPIANLVAGPLMTALLVVGLLTVPVATAVPALVGLLAAPEGLANASIFAARALGDLPFAAVAVQAQPWQLIAPYAAALAAYALWRPWRAWQLRAALAIALGAVGVHVARWCLFAPPAVTVLDVGQADAILVRDGSKTLLVDAGVDEQAAAALARNHVFALDAVVITHWDRDHWGGLPAILQTVPVGRLVVAEGATRAMPEEVRASFTGEVIEVGAGDLLRAGGFACRVVWPRQAVAGEQNGESVCLDVFYDEGGRRLRALLTGDTELEAERIYAQEVGDIDMLKVGHHGSKISVDLPLLETLDPEIAVASAGEGNSYGHPSAACTDAVEAYGARFACTMEVGDVIVAPGDAGATVSYGR